MAQKKDNHDKYTYRITWSEEDEEYVGLCAEFPSLSWLAQTPEAALKGVSRLVHEITADMHNNGEAVPEPIATKHFSGKFMIRVPPEVHRQLAIQSIEAGVSLNRLASAKLSR
jgi:predicted HicB family RNase H-like nuclease